MRNLVYGVAGFVVVASLLPAFGAFGYEFARDARWALVADPRLGDAGEWLVGFTGSQDYETILVAALAFAAGIGFDWLARRAEGARFRFYADLGRRLETERERLVKVRQLDAGPDLDNEVTSEMTRAYMDQIALQKTLQNLGFKVPWLNWEEGTGMGQYLSVYIGYFAVLSAHLKTGHIKEARIASKRLVDWGSGRSPRLMYEGNLQRLY